MFYRSTWKRSGLRLRLAIALITGFQPIMERIGLLLNRTQRSISNILEKNWFGRQRSLVPLRFHGGSIWSTQPNTSRAEHGSRRPNLPEPKWVRFVQYGLPQPMLQPTSQSKFPTTMAQHGNLQRISLRPVSQRMVQVTSCVTQSP